DVVDILRYEHPVHRGGDLRQGGNGSVREHVTVKPLVDEDLTPVASDGVDEGDTAGTQAAIDRLHVDAMILRADVLQEPDGDHRVVRPARRAVVGKVQLDRKAAAQLGPQRELLA